MTNTDYIIREIEPRDNDQVKTIVQHVILEMGAPKVGTAYEDEALEDMHKTYQKDKSIYFANNKGLLMYNGARWKLYKSKNSSIVRSVKVIGDKIYTGSYMDFGYWKKNEFGTLEYNSITSYKNISLASC